MEIYMLDDALFILRFLSADVIFNLTGVRRREEKKIAISLFERGIDCSYLMTVVLGGAWAGLLSCTVHWLTWE